MNVHRTRWMLKVLGAAVCLAGAAALAWGWFAPCDVPVVEESKSRRPVKTTTEATLSLPTMEQFQTILNKPLRRPLVDPPPSATASVAKSASETKVDQPLFNVKLLGTVFEAQETFAILATAKGRIELRRVGERLGNAPDGPEVVKIDAERVELSHRGKPLTLELKRSKGIRP